MSKKKQSNPSEDLVQRVAEQMFLRDLVVRGPKFEKGGTRLRPKEAADLLIPFGSHLVAFQVKSKREEKPASEKTPTDFNRIQSRIDDACAQLKTIRRAIDSRHLRKFTNARGIEIDFDPEAIERITGIVVIDLIGEDAFPAEERTAIDGGYAFDHGMPIHIFTIGVFETLAEELDTVPDFLAYLEVREILLSKRVLIYPGNELDFLAFYKMNPKVIADAMEGRLHGIALDDGFWEQYKAVHAEAIAAREVASRPSRLIDRIIEEVWQTIDADTGVEFPGRPDIGGPGTVEAYVRVAHELSRLTRMERRLLGSTFPEKAVRAAERGSSYGLLKTTWGGVLILASTAERQERNEHLLALAGDAWATHGIEPVVAVGTEAYPNFGSTFDYLVLDGGFSDETKAEMTKAGSRFFQDPKMVFQAEYSDRVEADKPGADGDGPA